MAFRPITPTYPKLCHAPITIAKINGMPFMPNLHLTRFSLLNTTIVDIVMPTPLGSLARTTIIPQGYVHRFTFWVTAEAYTHQYEQAYEQTAPYMSDPGPSNTTDVEPVPATEPSDSSPTETDKARGRKRTKAQVNDMSWKSGPSRLCRLACPSDVFPRCEPRPRHSTVPHTTDEGYKEHLRRQPFYCRRRSVS